MSHLKAHAPDYKLIAAFSVILFFGLLMLASASQVVGADTFDDPYYHIKHQLLYGLLPGLALLVLMASVNYQHWKKFALFFLIAGFVMLVLVFIPPIGLTFGKAHRWINLGFTTFQPSEAMKLAAIIFFAAWFAQKRAVDQIISFHYTCLPFLAYLGTLCLLVAAEPDIGTLTVLVVISFGMYFVAGANRKHLLLVIVIGVLAFMLLVMAAPYRLARVKTFLNPGHDTQDQSYQINQSLLAVGSGGWWGVGFGHSKQKYQYLPEVVGDSIFAVVAEEFGFIITSAFIILFIFMTSRCLILATRLNDDFGQFILIGIGLWFFYQAAVNISAMVNILPLTGIPLPFFSYGSSALITALAAVGLMINISKYTRA